MKIPFERTISGAYRFAFANILSIIGIGWFPFLLFGAVVTGLVMLWLPQLTEFWSVFGKAANGPKIRPGAVPVRAGAGHRLLYCWLSCRCSWSQAMVHVGLMRKALGLHPGPVFIFFSLGSQVWRLLGSYVLLMLLAWGMMLRSGAGHHGGFLRRWTSSSAPAQAAVTGILIARWRCCGSSMPPCA